MSSKSRIGMVPSAIVLAAELGGGFSAEKRLAISILSAIDGELPLQRYIDAGRKAAARGVGVDAIESCAKEWATTTFHPVWAHMLGMNDPFDVLDCVNDYNGRPELARVEVFGPFENGLDAPYWELASEMRPDFGLRARRVSVPGIEDPWPCQLASFECIRFAVESAEHRAKHKIAAPRTLSGAAALIGAEKSPVAEACLVFEREGAMPAERMAVHLGCKKRTAERAAQAVGLTLGRLRLATMIVAATNRLASAESLTTIAMDCGFADSAHMSNVFKASCGMTPSSIRRRGRAADCAPPKTPSNSSSLAYT